MKTHLLSEGWRSLNQQNHQSVACIELNGGYTVQPVPAPTSTKLLLKSKNKEGGSNQKLILFKDVETPYPEHQSLEEPSNYQIHQS